MSESARNQAGDYECWLPNGQSTVEAIYALQQIMEKAYE